MKLLARLRKAFSREEVRSETGIAIYPTESGKWAIVWAGLEAEEAVKLLYGMADEIVAQRIPPREMRH